MQKRVLCSDVNETVKSLDMRDLAHVIAMYAVLKAVHFLLDENWKLFFVFISFQALSTTHCFGKLQKIHSSFNQRVVNSFLFDFEWKHVYLQDFDIQIHLYCTMCLFYSKYNLNVQSQNNVKFHYPRCICFSTNWKNLLFTVFYLFKFQIKYRFIKFD